MSDNIKKYSLSDFLNIQEEGTNFLNEFNKKLSDINFEKALSDYSIKLEKQSEKLSNAIININNHQKKLNKQQADLKNHELQLKENSSNTKIVKNLLITVIIALAVVIIWWCYETFFRFDEVKQNYIEKTTEYQKQLDLFRSDIDNLKQDQQKQDKYIEKEVERQLYKKIEELNLKKDSK